MPRAKEPTGKPTGKKTVTAKPARPAAKKTAAPRKRPARVAAPAAEAIPVLDTPGALAAARLGVDVLDSRPSEQSGKYVYCIIQTTEPLRFGRIGIGNEPADVHTVSYKDIAAVVSDTPLEVYDPTRENVLAHERVNEAVMRSYTVLPMSFSTVFKTREDIIELLRTA